MEERRKAIRRDLMVYTRVHDGISGTQVGNLLNITVGGAKVLSDKAIEPFTPMELHIELPEGIAEKSELVIPGISKWHQVDIDPDFYDVGFQFQEVDPIDQGIIEVFVDQYAVQEF